MAVEYVELKLKEKTWDPCKTSLSDGTAKFVSHEAKNGKLVKVREIIRDGATVTIRSLETGRVHEIPWSGCNCGVVAKEQPKAEQKQTRG
jgi:hypothetical protein